jgi:hypothetical protein
MMDSFEIMIPNSELVPLLVENIVGHMWSD